MKQQKELTNVGAGNITVADPNPAWISGSRINLGPGTTISGGATGFASTTDLAFHLYAKPTLIRTDIFEDRIELIYREPSLISSGFNPSPDRVFKQVYSCVDGKWNVSHRIYGQIIPATEEDYDFEPPING